MKKQLLFINGHLNAGGCERSLADLLKHLDYEKYDVDLLLLEDLGDYYNELPENVNVIFYPLGKAFGSFFDCLLSALRRRDWFSFWYRIVHLYSSKFGIRKMRHVRKLFKKVKKHYDVIIAYRPGVCTNLAAYVFKADKKISWWHHGELNLNNSEVGELNDAYSRMNRIVAVSNSSKELVENVFICAKGKTVVVPNMICIDDLIIKSKENVEFDNSRKLSIITVGRFSREKNMPFCINVAEQLSTVTRDFIWYLIGDGEEYEKVLKAVSDVGLSDNFILTGRLENPYPYIKNADLMIHPSLVESQGLTVLESMALGTPVIVVDSAGPREFIVNEKNGFLTKPCAKDIAKIITDIKDDRKKLASISNEAKKTIEMFSPELIMEKIYKLFSD